MKQGMLKGLMAGFIAGGSLAMIYGVMNWKKERQWNRMAKQTGSWVSDKASDLAKKL